MFLLCSKKFDTHCEQIGNIIMIKETQRIFKRSSKTLLIDSITCGLIVLSPILTLYIPTILS